MKKRIKYKQLKEKVKQIFKENPNKALNYKQIAKILNIKKQRNQIIEILEELREEKFLFKVKPGKYQLHPKSKRIIGILDLSKKDLPIVQAINTEEIIYIPPNKLNHALHNDKVEVVLSATKKRKYLQGEIVKVIERTKQQFVGTIIKSDKFAFLVTNYKSMPYDIFIPPENLNGAQNGDKAIAIITNWPEYAKNPIGKIIKILGRVGDNLAEMLSILTEFDLPYEFPEEVIKEAEQIPEKIPQEEYKRRKDFRDVLTFTIDPVDAKDFDDALSFKKIKDNLFQIGVHIADVSYYVKENSALDKEAEKRSTSIYMVDKVVPMLPEKLSNKICSLTPNEDKLTFSIVFNINNEGKILKTWIGETIINSNRRYTYEEVQKIIDTKQGDNSEAILTLHNIAQKLRQKRLKNGAIAFEAGELKFKLDPKGKPIDVFLKIMQPANQLIEEFMLLANKKIAERIGKNQKQKRVFVYRVHDKPDMEKVQNFARYVKSFGYQISTKTPKTFALSLNNLLEQIKNDPILAVVSQLGIKTMSRAIYSTDNIGHFGLAFNYYTHFTSPIRRYPDILVHRLVKRYLLQNKKSVSKKLYEKKCKYASEIEHKAQQAEWAAIKYKAVEFMKDKLGQEFVGVIASLNEWGMFVQLLENNIEGTILIRDIEDDFYIYDEENFCIIGEYTGKKYKIGDKVIVKVIKADLIKRQLDFKIIKKYNDETNHSNGR